MIFPKLTFHFPTLCLQEKLLRECGVPIPDGAGSKRSYSLKPPNPCHMEDASSLGILSLDCTLGGGPHKLQNE